MSEKDLLRQSIKSTLSALSIEEQSRRSRLIESQLLEYLVELDHHSPLTVVGLYLPLRGEPRFDLHRWSAFPWKLAYPTPDGDGMKFVLPSTLPGKGHWVGHGSECSPDVIVVPGLVFSNLGYRVGRGGGYYDKLLASWRPSRGCIGVCFDEQLRENFEVQAHDQKMDVVITDLKILGRG